MILHLKIHRIILSLFIGATAFYVAALLLPKVGIANYRNALLIIIILAILNAIISPIISRIKIPYALLTGFFILLFVNGWYVFLIAQNSWSGLEIDYFYSALVLALVASALSIIIEVIFNIDSDDTYNLKVISRIARKSKNIIKSKKAGIIYLEIDGLAYPILQDAIKNGFTPNIANWLASGSHNLTEWETDLSSQTGASQAGILLGNNKNIPAFRWINKKSGTIMTCSDPKNCELLEKDCLVNGGLLDNGGASRSNLFSGGAKEVMVTVSKLQKEKTSNQNYRTFFANSFNVTRLFVLFTAEIFVELYFNLKSKIKNVKPRGHRGGKYPLIRAAVTVFIRDLTVFAVLTDIFYGRPAIYATFAGYDEVAHHSGLEAQDTMKVLKKIDMQFGRINNALKYAPRPYKIVVLSDHGQTEGATFEQRNGHSLQDFISKIIGKNNIIKNKSGDENETVTSKALNEALKRDSSKESNENYKNKIAVLGSGNLGLVYFADYNRRLTLEEIQKKYPNLIESLKNHPNIGWIMLNSAKDGPIVMGHNGNNHINSQKIIGKDPLNGFSKNAVQHIKRANSFNNAPDILINSFYDNKSQQGCAFEELISFHGGMGGPQTRPFLLYPKELQSPKNPIVGAESLHKVLKNWRTQLQK